MLCFHLGLNTYGESQTACFWVQTGMLMYTVYMHCIEYMYICVHDNDGNGGGGSGGSGGSGGGGGGDGGVVVVMVVVVVLVVWWW